MDNIPDPIFKDRLSKISWKKIYDREYGVQYSEAAVGLLAFATYHFPKTSFTQIVIPGEGNNTAFYIDDISWVELVEGLNKKYTSNVKNLEKYEKQFFFDGKKYLETAKKISKLDLTDLSNKEVLAVFLNHQDKKSLYSVFAWTAFILNNYVADRATSILETYIKKYHRENEKQEIIDALFSPEKRAAIMELQYQVENHGGKLTKADFNSLYEQFKWLSCLDIQNKPWSKEEFREHIKSFTKPSKKKEISFEKIIKELKPNKKDLEYLLMAKRFVYIKDARDDIRRESVFYANNLFEELGRRMGISTEGTSYLLDEEIINFLKHQVKISHEVISQRKQGFVLYIGANEKLVCLQGDQIEKALKLFDLLPEEEKIKDITGRIVSKGLARGKVSIVKGIKDIKKVKQGDILVAVTTHPDYVPAMRVSAAIVTDEGGITSHAAIVAREFNIPCIVGTKVATKILKDGDLVEVDANSGSVKKNKLMYIKLFSEISKDDVNLVGGKGASLGEMVNANFPVPPGFVITPEGFQKNINEEILKAFDNLNSEMVAVRSSSVAEDSSKASWAGQLETYLNVSREDLINKVKECWESIKSERAVDYASQQNLSKEQMQVAVVVQKMVNSQAAGVMFTVNPVTRDENEIMIESVLGLGESLVQGSVTPDNFIVDKKTLEINSKDLQQENKQTISDKNIKKLVELGKKIEDHYGSPQDIEWAIDDQNNIWILQSRPITTL